MTCSASVRVESSYVLSLAFALSFATQTPLLAQSGVPLDAALVVGSEQRQIVKTLDLDGDGWTDAVGWWTVRNAPSYTGHGELTGWINDGAGHLVEAWSIPYTTGLWEEDIPPVDRCEVADLDGDGDDDFVAGATLDSPSGSYVQRVRVYLSNGAQPPTLAIFGSGFVDELTSLSLADFDADGKLDLAMSSGQSTRLYRMNFAGATLEMMSFIAASGSFDRVVAAELTGDGRPDLFIEGNIVSPIVDGVAQPPIIYPPLPDFPSSVSLRHDVGDIDADGDLDAITFIVDPTGAYPASYRVLRRTSPTTLVAEPVTAGGPARRLVDVDGDGSLDGVCCGGGLGESSPPTNILRSFFRVALNDGTGAFAGAISIPSLGSKAIAGVADLDHDGDADLVAGRCVYYVSGPITAQPAGEVGQESQRRSTIADIDRDGDPDFEPELSLIRRNRGDGSVDLEALNVAPPPSGFTRVGTAQSGDFDGDGDVDFMVKLAPDALELLYNLGFGRFESAGVVANSDGLASFATPAKNNALAADVDGDGDPDFVSLSRSFGYDGSAWWRNDGPVFIRQEGFLDHWIQWVGDLDGDGIPDLLAQGPLDRASNTTPLRWCAGLGAGAFAEWQVLSGSSSRMGLDQIAVADFDSDGRVDIAAVRVPEGNPSSVDAFVHWNDGAGVFQRTLVHDGRFDYVAGTSAVAGDFDGDGRTDLALGPHQRAPNAVTILLKHPTARQFLAPTQQVIFDRFVDEHAEPEMAVADVDGDGDSDLLTQRRYANRQFEGEAAGSRIQLGGATAGTGGVAPILGASGPFRVGERVRLHLRGLRPDSRGIVAISGHSGTTLGVSAGGMQPDRPGLRAIPFHATGSPGDAPGSGWCEIEFTVPAALASSTRAYVAHVIDDAAPGGRSRSNALLLTYGP